jgi:hypothetical protein
MVSQLLMSFYNGLLFAIVGAATFGITTLTVMTFSIETISMAALGIVLVTVGHFHPSLMFASK